MALLMNLIYFFQARAFFQAAYNLAPVMFEPHFNFATLSDKVRFFLRLIQNLIFKIT